MSEQNSGLKPIHIAYGALYGGIALLATAGSFIHLGVGLALAGIGYGICGIVYIANENDW
jgi:hypothetical protein